MTRGVGPDFVKLNADTLDRALQSRRRALRGVDKDERERREVALAAIQGYTALPRQPVGQGVGWLPRRAGPPPPPGGSRWSRRSAGISCATASSSSSRTAAGASMR